MKFWSTQLKILPAITNKDDKNTPANNSGYRNTEHQHGAKKVEEKLYIIDIRNRCEKLE